LIIKPLFLYGKISGELNGVAENSEPIIAVGYWYKRQWIRAGTVDYVVVIHATHWRPMFKGPKNMNDSEPAIINKTSKPEELEDLPSYDAWTPPEPIKETILMSNRISYTQHKKTRSSTMMSAYRHRLLLLS